jgi:hypothetical protein
LIFEFADLINEMVEFGFNAFFGLGWINDFRLDFFNCEFKVCLDARFVILTALALFSPTNKGILTFASFSYTILKGLASFRTKDLGFELGILEGRLNKT